MYFPEEKRKDPVIKNVPSSHIKCPITSGYTSQALDKYIKKEFHDKGSTGEDPDEPYFEAGDFVVDSIVSGNNFNCSRIGVPDSSIQFDIGYVIERIVEYEKE